MKVDIKGVYSESEEVLSDSQILEYLSDMEQSLEQSEFNFKRVNVIRVPDTKGSFSKKRSVFFENELRNEMRVNENRNENNQVQYA